jgi:ATP/maltotriose-dependent transcriptional regulator MalT
MKQSKHLLENAENCAQLAERAADEPTHKRYKRMEAAWRALAEEQDWLDGEVSPVRIAVDRNPQKAPSAA